MCFSATASMTAATILVPLGIYGIRNSAKYCPEYIGFSILPLGFGIQQFFEGLIWLLIPNQSPGLMGAIFGFLFFSHFFWLFMVPFAAWFRENHIFLKKVLFTIMVIGGILGISFIVPLIINDGWFSAIIRHDSIYYSITKIYDGYLSTGAMLFVYILFILIPLMISSKRDIRIFGYLLGVSMIITLIFFQYAFVSIWCYFAAMLSCLLLVIIKKETAQSSKSASIG